MLALSSGYVYWTTLLLHAVRGAKIVYGKASRFVSILKPFRHVKILKNAFGLSIARNVITENQRSASVKSGVVFGKPLRLTEALSLPF